MVIIQYTIKTNVIFFQKPTNTLRWSLMLLGSRFTRSSSAMVVELGTEREFHDPTPTGENAGLCQILRQLACIYQLGYSGPRLQGRAKTQQSRKPFTCSY